MTYFLDGNMLFIDLLAIHMIRNVKTSTIISYHPESTWCQTSAKHLNKLMLLVGGSVYWQNIFTKTKDPTFLFLTILWYALYAWDESFELLYNHVNILVRNALMRVAMTLLLTYSGVGSAAWQSYQGHAAASCPSSASSALPITPPSFQKIGELHRGDPQSGHGVRILHERTTQDFM